MTSRSLRWSEREDSSYKLDGEAEVILCEDSNHPSWVGLIPGSHVIVDGEIVFAKVLTGPDKVQITSLQGSWGAVGERTTVNIEVYGRQGSAVDFICRQNP